MVSSPWCKQTVCRIYLSIFSHTLCGRLPRWVSKFGAYRQLTHSLISVGRCAGASIFGGPQMRHYEDAICLQFIKMWHQWHISHHEIKNEIIQVLKHDELQYLSWCTSVIVTALQLNRNDAEPVKTQVCVCIHGRQLQWNEGNMQHWLKLFVHSSVSWCCSWIGLCFEYYLFAQIKIEERKKQPKWLIGWEKLVSVFKVFSLGHLYLIVMTLNNGSSWMKKKCCTFSGASFWDIWMCCSFLYHC